MHFDGAQPDGKNDSLLLIIRGCVPLFEWKVRLLNATLSCDCSFYKLVNPSVLKSFEVERVH